MIADALLSRLDGCRRTGVNRWIAKCPAHDDRHPSLSIRELDREKVLVKCWSGCSAANVLAAAGLEFSALYPPRLTHRTKPERKSWPAADILRCVEQEILIGAVATLTLANGGVLSDGDRARLLVASERLTAAVMEAGYA